MNFDGFFLVDPAKFSFERFEGFLDAHTKFLASLSNDWTLYRKYHSKGVEISEGIFTLVLKTNSPKRVVTMVHFTTISGHFLKYLSQN